jgi:predicted alpha/beta-hydrolase family hydrolase
MTATTRGGATVVEVATPGGPARVQVRRPRGARWTMVLGHGAGGGLKSVDLTAAWSALDAEGWATALVEQPWLVAGRRVAGPPPTLDAAWLAVVETLRSRGGALATVRGPLVLGGRSAGARVACRTAVGLRADAVLCLSFPLHLPGYADRPDKSRSPELRLVTDAALPIASVQGENDPFGTAAELAAYLPPGAVYPVAGTHTIPRSSAAAVSAAVLHFTGPLRD